MQDLPSWNTIPADIPSAISEIKRAIRSRIEANGRTVESVAEEIETFLRAEIAEDDFFSSVDSKPEIYPIYWSKAQMEARQHQHMAMRSSS